MAPLDPSEIQSFIQGYQLDQIGHHLANACEQNVSRRIHSRWAPTAIGECDIPGYQQWICVSSPYPSRKAARQQVKVLNNSYTAAGCKPDPFDYLGYGYYCADGYHAVPH